MKRKLSLLLPFRDVNWNWLPSITESDRPRTKCEFHMTGKFCVGNVRIADYGLCVLVQLTKSLMSSASTSELSSMMW